MDGTRNESKRNVLLLILLIFININIFGFVVVIINYFCAVPS